MQTKSDGQKRSREESCCRRLICHLSLEYWWLQQWFISLTEAELKWTYGSNVWTLMMSNSSSLPLWIRFTSCSTRQSVRDVRGEKSPKMNRGGKMKMIKQLQFQRTCFYFSSFLCRDVILFIWQSTGCATGLWPIANELFSAGNADRGDGPAGRSICTYK